ncbi:TIGR02444 family protein [Pseudomonas sp. SH1-B]
MQELWNFALKLYSAPGVEQACLELQESGSDVCLLLTAAWLQQRGVRYMDERLHTLQGVAASWQGQVVSPLRQLRRAWRTTACQDTELASLREQLKKLELQAEQVLLERLQSAAEQWPGGESADDWLTPLLASNGAALQVLRDAIKRA